MRVRITAPHHGPAIFKDLDVIDKGQLAKFVVLLCPNVHHPPQISSLHLGQAQVVTRRKADDTADSRLAARNQQASSSAGGSSLPSRGLMHFAAPGVGQQGGIIIVENIRPRVSRGARAGGSAIAGTHVTVWVVTRLRLGRKFFHLALPRPLRTMGRHQNPLLRQGIEAPVGMFFKSKLAMDGLGSYRN